MVRTDARGFIAERATAALRPLPWRPPGRASLGRSAARRASWFGPKGALASGGGYSLWYAVLPTLGATRAAAVQLAAPVLAGLGATAFLGERLTPRIVVAGATILGGIALTLRR
jgi:drug/metabolite transporter (DMT)-like permease